MKDCSPTYTFIVLHMLLLSREGGEFNQDQCPQNALEREYMKSIPYYLL